MLERILRLNESIESVLYNYDNQKYLHKRLDMDDIKKIKVLCEVLKPYFLITELLSGEKYATQSIVLPSANMLLEKV